MLKLIGIESKEEILLTAVCYFSDNSEKLNHILFPNNSNEDIFKLFHEQKIIEHVYDIHQNGAASGYVCKLLYKTEPKLKENRNTVTLDNDEYDHGIDFSHWNDDLDNDEQSEEFWNQF